MRKPSLPTLAALSIFGFAALVLLRAPGTLPEPQTTVFPASSFESAPTPGAHTIEAPPPHVHAKSGAADRTTPIAEEPEGLEDEDAADLVADELRAQLLAQRLQTRSAELQRERLAQERFNRALTESGITAASVRPGVRELFQRMELKSILDDAGMFIALEIAALDPESPLAASGFQPGDRITHINDTPLRDPADLPQVITSLRDSVRVCADRQGEEICGVADVQ